MNNEQKTSPETGDEKYNVELVNSIDQPTLEEIQKLDDSVMPEDMKYESGDLKECFESKEGIHILVKNNNGEIIGYLTSLPKNIEYEFLHNEDPEFTMDDTSIYVESVVIKGGDFANAKNVFNSFMQEAVDRGYKNVSMHARVSQGLSNVLQKRYGAKFFRRIENWYGYGEPFDYLEIYLNDLTKDNN
jgi:hypothetical protein